MAKELTTISPEGLEIANSYLQYGNIRGVCEYLQVPEQQVVDVLNKREVKKYIDTVYLDMGYRNKNNIGSVRTPPGSSMQPAHGIAMSFLTGECS